MVINGGKPSIIKDKNFHTRNVRMSPSYKTGNPNTIQEESKFENEKQEDQRAITELHVRKKRLEIELRELTI